MVDKDGNGSRMKSVAPNLFGDNREVEYGDGCMVGDGVGSDDGGNVGGVDVLCCVMIPNSSS